MFFKKKNWGEEIHIYALNHKVKKIKIEGYHKVKLFYHFIIY